MIVLLSRGTVAEILPGVDSHPIPSSMNNTPTTGSGDPPGFRRALRIRHISVTKIRPEEGLGRTRDRAAHRELCRSIEQFGVLTPITVRAATDGSGEFLLIKGQGRTLACRLLGIQKIPAIVLSEQVAEVEKVRQFLVENVARLRMRPIDRALLIAHARTNGEETEEVARRFGVSAATVRRLESQLRGATPDEVASLRSGDLNLSLHAVISTYIPQSERWLVISVLRRSRVGATDLQAILLALDWKALSEVDSAARPARFELLAWACSTFASLPRGPAKDRIRHLARALPLHLPSGPARLGGAR